MMQVPGDWGLSLLGWASEKSHIDFLVRLGPCRVPSKGTQLGHKNKVGLGSFAGQLFFGPLVYSRGRRNLGLPTHTTVSGMGP